MSSASTTRRMVALVSILTLLLIITCTVWLHYNGEYGHVPTPKYHIQSKASSPLHIVDRMEDLYYHMIQRNSFIRRHSDQLTPSFRNAMSKIRKAVEVKLANERSKIKQEDRPTCPEAYHGAKSDYPDYLTNWKFSSCPNRKPLSSLITICIIASKATSKGGFINTLETITGKYKNLSIIVATETTLLDWPTVQSKFRNVRLVNAGKSHNSLYVWKSLINLVKTPYLVLGRRFTGLGHYTDLTRAVHVLSESSSIDAVSFGNLNTDRVWNIDCFQVTLRDYEMRMIEGYRRSFNECTVCDYVDGPFMTKSSTLKKYELDLNVGDEDLGFLDLFLRLRGERRLIVSCPDMMTSLTTSRSLYAKAKNAWLPFVQKWQVNRFSATEGKSLQFTCAESKTSCNLKWYIKQGLNTPLCCRRALSKMIVDFHKFCERHKIQCEVDRASALGAVKLNHTLPWDEDANVLIHKDNHSILIKHQSEFEKIGYLLKISSDDSFIEFVYQAPELEGISMKCLTREPYISIGNVHTGIFKPTRILLDGHLVNVPYNPGLYVRNKYGKELYRHATVQKTSKDQVHWIVKPCKIPKHHACTDGFPADGNMKLVYRRS